MGQGLWVEIQALFLQLQFRGLLEPQRPGVLGDMWELCGEARNAFFFMPDGWFPFSSVSPKRSVDEEEQRVLKELKRKITLCS